jgi:hypothetical protein
MPDMTIAAMQTTLTKEILIYRVLISAPPWIPKIENQVPELISLNGMKLLRRHLNGACHLKLTVPLHANHIRLENGQTVASDILILKKSSKTKRPVIFRPVYGQIASLGMSRFSVPVDFCLNTKVQLVVGQAEAFISKGAYEENNTSPLLYLSMLALVIFLSSNHYLLL